jgi:lipopolysaccharide/colanic/teichoic acid biosynthesis glycosyltransferase
MRVEFCIGDDYGGPAAAAFYQQLIATGNVRRGPVPKLVDDPRWTRVGRWIRRWSLDELPQLCNVLLGDMSLVGPRPHFPSEIANYERHHRKVLAVKPGLTGLAQVSGRSDLDFEEEVRLDRYYLEHWTWLLDLTIMLRTIVAIVMPRRTI